MVGRGLTYIHETQNIEASVVTDNNNPLLNNYDKMKNSINKSELHVQSDFGSFEQHSAR